MLVSLKYQVSGVGGEDGEDSSSVDRVMNARRLTRLDYQPLFGKGARAPPRTDGWTHGLSIVNFDQ